MKSTPEIIELAKQIWKKGWRQDIREGDWYMVKGHWRPALSTAEMGGATVKQQGGGLIPIPTLTNCLDFIEKRTIRFYAFAIRDKKPMFICDVPGDSLWIKAETREEAAMLAVIKILEGE